MSAATFTATSPASTFLGIVSNSFSSAAWVLSLPCSCQCRSRHRQAEVHIKIIKVHFDSVPPGVRLATQLGAHTGLRRTEAAALRVEDVDFAT